MLQRISSVTGTQNEAAFFDVKVIHFITSKKMRGKTKKKRKKKTTGDDKIMKTAQ
ncbi:MAG: hypothetical protein LUI13_05290 [Lachnospiraceae bacterium]|nr:hypothetical protein [Lachnospiraceae bacterium]